MNPRLGAVLVLAAIVAPAAARDPLNGRVAGTPQQCVQLSSSAGNGLYVLDRTSLAYQQGRRLWRNVPIGRCSLQPFDTIVTEVFGGQLCRNDRFRTVTPGLTIPSAPCRLGAWVPYVKVK